MNMMLLLRPSQSACRACRLQFHSLLSRGIADSLPGCHRLDRHHVRTGKCPRAFHNTPISWDSTLNSGPTLGETEADIEATVRQVWETYGHVVPSGKLSQQEYLVFQRLYGTPTLPSEYEEHYKNELEEVNQPSGPVGYQPLQENIIEDLESIEIEDDTGLDFETEQIILNQIREDEKAAAHQRQRHHPMQSPEFDKGENNKIDGLAMSEEAFDMEEEKESVGPEEEAEGNARLEERLQAEKDFDEFQGGVGSGDSQRTHPFTLAGRSETTPSTIFLPKDMLVRPIQEVLSTASNKHLREISAKVFGGEALPDSVATLSIKGHLHQKPVALEAAQSQMTAMEANAYLAANMPGIYASITSVLVEIRKRLGSEWLEGLLERPGGPRVLDAGGAGAGVLAWRDVLRAEWQRIHPGRTSVPGGRATAVVGSDELGSRVSTILEETTILPRMPEFVPARDLQVSRSSNPSARKLYDIIIAPHTLWTLKEDYMRKLQVQNYWSLLDPNGGVLILLEKGVPRGFELVAGARETLLKKHISSPGSERYENDISLDVESRYTKKEAGSIIAPCTNHGTCPMYTTPGQMAGRKEHCHFQQRFIRPPFLQNLVGKRGQNHEDIRFSYVAVQRGRDIRQERQIAQDESATLAALQGFEAADAQPAMLSLPRILLPPIKRHKHVIFDVCTPSAQLERWTLPASKSKQGYRDARKARWGDLWALGAKTRVVRTARSGAPMKENPASRQELQKKRKKLDRSTHVRKGAEGPEEGFDGGSGAADARPNGDRYSRRGRKEGNRKEWDEKALDIL